MNRPPKFWIAGLVLCLTAAATANCAPATFSDWQTRQQLSVSNAGIVKLRLPLETLDRARPDLEDLRVLDPTGAEVPYLIERPQTAGKTVRPPNTLVISLKNNSTVITMETGMSLPLEAVRLETPARDFIKPVRAEGSLDQKDWHLLAEDRPIFRRANVSQLRLPLSGSWAHLRLTVSDERSESIPFTGALLESVEGPTVTNEPFPVTISERGENPGQTRLALNLGAANLELVSLQFTTPEPLFTRQVTLAYRQVSENALREQSIATGAIYRVQLEGQPVWENLQLPVERRVPSRELIALVENGDSPPLPISGVSARCRPVYAIFIARTPGQFTILTGNARAMPPHYDLTALGSRLKDLPIAPVRPTTLTPNPSYHPSEQLPEITDAGAALDVTAWQFRKRLTPATPGVQELELDLEAMAHAQPGFADLRLIRDGRQLPYVLEHTSITRALVPEVAAANDRKRPTQTRWSFKLPQPALPVSRLACASDSPLFKRDVRLYELVSDDRGRNYENDLGHTSWTQTPDRRSKQFTLELSARPSTETLFLETDNGDNPLINLSSFQFYYPVTRVLFKSSAAPLYLYYGNQQAPAPTYDLNLMAQQILAADKLPVSVGPEERLKKGAWRNSGVSTRATVLFWGILGLVIVALLVLISRLLPKHEPSQ